MGAFERLARLWEDNASMDPLWGILALPGKDQSRWDPNDFFRTGERDVAELWQYLRERGALPRAGRALDFGCGVGRLTRALAPHFERVDGVDVSATMIDHARRYTGRDERIRYEVLTTPDLHVFADGTFDLVLSILVVQHIPPPLNSAFLCEMARVTAPGGVLLVQAPHAARRAPRRPSPLRRLAARALRRGRLTLEMYALPRDEVTRALADNGCAVLDVRSDGWAGDDWESYLYLARKEAGASGARLGP